MKICDTFGAGFSYIPGTNTCVNQDTGETRRTTDDGVVAGQLKFISEGNEGVALGMALSGATVDAGKTYGAKSKVGTFMGETAIGRGGAMQLDGGVTVDGAYGRGLHHGTSGGRVGVNFSW